MLDDAIDGRFETSNRGELTGELLDRVAREGCSEKFGTVTRAVLLVAKKIWANPRMPLPVIIFEIIPPLP